MTVSVKFHRYLLCDSAGSQTTTETSGHTLRECLEQATARFPKLKNEVFDPSGRLQGHILLLLNVEEAQTDELNRKVSDGDIIEVIPIIGGG